MFKQLHNLTPRFALLERPRLWTRNTHEQFALYVFRGSRGMGKSVAVRQLATSQFDQAYTVQAEQMREDCWETIGSLAAEANSNRLSVAVAIEGSEAIAENRHLRREFSSMVIRVLERFPNLSIIVSGAGALGLDSVDVQLRVPTLVVDDNELLFTPTEVAQLCRLRVDGTSEAFVQEVISTTGGWPLLVHGVLTEITDSGTPAVSIVFIDSFHEELLTRTLASSTQSERAALLIVGGAERLTAEELACALSCSMEEAENALTKLAGKVLMQTSTGDGMVFSHHPRMRPLLWRKRRQIATPDELRTWVEGLSGLADRRTDVSTLTILAAFDSHDWSGLSNLLTSHISEEFAEPSELLLEQLREVPELALRQFPMLKFVVLLGEYAQPGGQRARIEYEFGEFAKKALKTESQFVEPTGILSLGMRITAARLGGKETLALELVEALEERFSLLPRNYNSSVHTMLVTVCAQVAVTLWFSEKIVPALSWVHTGLGLVEDKHSLGWAHLLGLQALIQAWSGNIFAAEETLSTYRRHKLLEQWHRHFVLTPYYLASAIVAIERRDYASARDAYGHVESDIVTNEQWPYFVWIQGLLLEEQFSVGHALAWITSHIEARRQTAELFSGALRAVNDLTARFAWQSAQTQHLPKMRGAVGLQGVYSLLNDANFVDAAVRASAVAFEAASNSMPRLEARALLLRVVAERELHDSAEVGTRQQALKLLKEHGLTVPKLERPPWWNLLPESEPVTIGSPHYPPAFDVRGGEQLNLTQQLTAGGPSNTEPFPATTGRQAHGRLTKSEIRTLRAVSEHGTSRKAAERLHLSVHTVRDHLKMVYRKLGVHTREDALRAAAQTGLLTFTQDPDTGP